MQRVFNICPIYWINLDSSTDRFTNMSTQLINTNNHRISAIDGRNSNEFKNKYKIINANNYFSTALIAVICSHIKAIKIAYDKKLPYVIILEDKCHFDLIEYYKHSIEDIINLANTVDNMWELIQLYYCPITDNLNDYKLNGLKLHKIGPRDFSLNYLINYKGMEEILSRIPTDGDTFFDLKNVKHYRGPEELIYFSLKSYRVNCPVFYTYADISTFDHYYVDTSVKKNENFTVQKQVLQLLLEYYDLK